MFEITNSLATKSSATKWVGDLEQCDAPKQHNYLFCFGAMLWKNLQVTEAYQHNNQPTFMHSTQQLLSELH